MHARDSKTDARSPSSLGSTESWPGRKHPCRPKRNCAISRPPPLASTSESLRRESGPQEHLPDLLTGAHQIASWVMERSSWGASGYGCGYSNPVNSYELPANLANERIP